MSSDLALSPDLAKQALSSAAESILETMFFTAADAIEQPTQWDGPLIAAQLDYSGRFSGRFQLELDHTCAVELASNALGEPGGSEPAAHQSEHLACELANMLCGNTLNRLEPAEQFNLTAPLIVPPRSGCECPAGRPYCAVHWLQTDSGLLRLCFEWKG